MSHDILVHTEAGITTLTFNRPNKKNSITTAMYAMLADALEAAQSDDSVRCVVFQGHETVFSAGNDIGDFLNQPPSTESSPVFRFMRNLITFPKPVIAAVCGPAVGIGTTLLMHCDLVYAGDNATFVMPFVDLGLCPEFSSSLLVPQMMGYHRAAEALLLGEPMAAEAAREAGLVNRVVPSTEAASCTQAVAKRLAAKPLSALVATKALMKQGQNQNVLAVMDKENEHFSQLLQEPAAREALAAFMERRKPDFSKY